MRSAGVMPTCAHNRFSASDTEPHPRPLCSRADLRGVPRIAVPPGEDDVRGICPGGALASAVVATDSRASDRQLGGAG